MSLLLLLIGGDPGEAFLSPSPAGITAGANAPTLAVEVAPNSAGITVGVGPAVSDTAVGAFDADADTLRQASELPANVNSPFTITGVMRRTSGGAAGSIAGVWAGSIYTELSFNTAGNVRLGSNLGRVDVLASFPLNEWYFFAITNSGGTRVLNGYVQPVAGGTLSQASTTNVNDTSAATYLYLAGGETAGLQLRGDLTEVRFWTRELSQAEVEAEWANGRTPASTTNLVGHYPLLDDTTKLTASVGGNLSAKGAGTWSTVDGPFSAAGLHLTYGSDVTPNSAGVTVGANAPTLAVDVTASAGVQVGAQAPGLSASVPVGEAGALVGAAAPGLAVSLEPAAAGVVVGAQAPAVVSTVTPSVTGVLVGAVAPELAADVSSSAAGVLAGAQTPTLATVAAPAAAGALVGASAPTLAVGAQQAPAGALVGASAPTLAVALAPSSAGVQLGAEAPALVVVLSVSPGGVAVGANAPTLSASISPSSAGVTAGAWAPNSGGTVDVAPTSAGVVAGAHAPELLVALVPGVAGVVAGAAAPSLSAELELAAAGLELGAWAPSLALSITPGVPGVVFGVPAPAVGWLVPHYSTPGQLAGAAVVLELVTADVVGAPARASVPSPATVEVASPVVGVTPS